KRILSANDRVFFSVVLGFEPDEELERYYHELFNGMSDLHTAGDPKIRLGMLGIHVETGTQYASIRIGAVARMQNQVMQYSTSVHREMLQIIETCGGIAALLDMEVGDDETISLFV